MEKEERGEGKKHCLIMFESTSAFFTGDFEREKKKKAPYSQRGMT